MKKQYIAPKLHNVKIQTARMIAISSATMSTEGQYRITSEDEFGSRRGRNAWDDEDDDY